MNYNIEQVKNGWTVDCDSSTPYERDTYVFSTLDEASNWIKFYSADTQAA